MKQSGLPAAGTLPDDPVELCRSIAESMPLMVWIAGADGSAISCNSRLCAYTGLAARELLSWGWIDALHPADRARVEQRWRHALSSGEPYEEEIRLRRHDGAYRWHLDSASPLKDVSGGIVGWLGLCTDIDDRKRAAALLEETVAERTRSLRESEARFHSLADLTAHWYWEQDEQFRFTRFSPDVASLPGSSVEWHLGKTRWELPTVGLTAEAWAKHRAALEAHLPFHDFEFQRINERGETIWVSVSGVPIFDDTGQFRGYRGIGRNITDRKQVELALRDSERRIRELLKRLTDTQEAERRRIAAHLHDLVGQNLAALGIGLETLRTGMPRERAQQHSPIFDDMAKLVTDTMDMVRQTISDLRPPLLDDYGLLAALESHARQFTQRTGLPVMIDGRPIDARLAPNVELALFRIAQEALANAAKHANASRAQVTLARSGGFLRLSIEDDGEGFAQPSGARAARRGGWGLPMMRERAEEAGGTLRIEFPGRGTRVVAEVPHVDPNHPG